MLLSFWLPFKPLQTWLLSDPLRLKVSLENGTCHQTNQKAKEPFDDMGAPKAMATQKLQWRQWLRRPSGLHGHRCQSPGLRFASEMSSASDGADAKKNVATVSGWCDGIGNEEMNHGFSFWGRSMSHSQRTSEFFGRSQMVQTRKVEKVRPRRPSCLPSRQLQEPQLRVLVLGL